MYRMQTSNLSVILIRILILAACLVGYFGTARAYNFQTQNVIDAYRLLSRENIRCDIFAINAKPACVFEVGTEYWFYDGVNGSSKLGFLPDSPITATFKMERGSSLPLNSCLIQALIAYNRNRSHRYDAIVFLPHHAFNLYSDSDSEFKRALALFPVVDIFGVSRSVATSANGGTVCYASTL